MAKPPKEPQTVEDQKRDEVLARMLNTPPNPKRKPKGEKTNEKESPHN